MQSENNNTRVLIVEDNEAAAWGLKKLLTSRGFTVKTAPTGGQGCKMAEDFRPQAVLLDIGLPDMDGYAVARDLRKQPATRNVKILAMTGFGDDETRERVAQADFNAHLVKPVKLEKFLTALKSDS